MPAASMSIEKETDRVGQFMALLAVLRCFCQVGGGGGK
jgi:hypothetical protein